jgi:hypothetical protein
MATFIGGGGKEKKGGSISDSAQKNIKKVEKILKKL